MPVLQTALQHDSYIPYHVQVRESLTHYIEEGGWQVGDQMPSEPDLCQLFHVSRPVIRQALKEMEHEGIVTRRKGKGTFVLKPRISEGLAQKLTGFYHDMVDRGLTPVTRVLKQRLIEADKNIAEKLSVAPGSPVIELERLRFVGDVPLVLVTSYLPYSLCPQVLEADLTQQSLYEFLDQQVGLSITHGKRYLEAVSCSVYQALLLNVEEGAAFIRLESVSYLEDNTPMEYYIAFHRGDRTQFEVELVRP